MYIISKFHDYYDSAATYGIDKTVIYKRERKEMTLQRARWNGGGSDLVSYPEETMNKLGQKVLVQEFLVGFCGQVYPAVRFTCGDRVACAYTAEQFFIEAVDFDLGVDWKAKNTTWSRMRFWRGGINAGYAKSFYARDWTKELGSKFVELHTPIFTVTSVGHKVILAANDSLKNHLFAKVQDPASAFQNIYMYISGVLGQPKDIPSKQTDKEKAASHGHDGEYSFKKPPGGKKWR